MDHQTVIARTQRWISSMVIGLNLCPFAQRVFQAGLVRYVVSDAEEELTLLKDLSRELKAFAAAPAHEVETTLLIHPRVLENFLDYNDFIGVAEQMVADLRLAGAIQIAGFHPAYQFAGTDASAVENYTNRSPYPMLHLLREESITAVAGDPDALLEIPKRNIATLQGLGLAKVLNILKEIHGDNGAERETPGSPSR